MKVAIFTTKEGYTTWLNNEIEAIRNNGLKNAREMYENAILGKGKAEWMNLNNTTDEKVWENHLRWLKDQITYLENKVRKYQRELAKIG